ncbi:hypothetical protein PtB15_15B153 [Puccinia triticina]|nr:hypothetical protein PtB15_15B153 [Puccinia triticina]
MEMVKRNIPTSTRPPKKTNVKVIIPSFVPAPKSAAKPKKQPTSTSKKNQKKPISTKYVDESNLTEEDPISQDFPPEDDHISQDLDTRSNAISSRHGDGEGRSHLPGYKTPAGVSSMHSRDSTVFGVQTNQQLVTVQADHQNDLRKLFRGSGPSRDWGHLTLA